MTNESTVMNRPPSSVTAQSGMELRKSTPSMASIISGGSALGDVDGEPHGVHHRRYETLHHVEERHHELQPVHDGCVGQHEPHEELQHDFRALDLGEGAAGLHEARQEEQDEQRDSHRLARAVDGEDRVPDPSALELGGSRGEQSHYLAHLLVPCVERALEVVHYPVVGFQAAASFRDVAFRVTPRSGRGFPWRT